MLSFRSISFIILLFSMSSASCYAGKLHDDIANRDQNGIAWRIKRNVARLEVCPTNLMVHYKGKINALIDIIGLVIHSNNPLADCKYYGYTGLFQQSSHEVKDFKKISCQMLGRKRPASVLTNKYTDQNPLGKSQESSLKRRRVSANPHEKSYSKTSQTVNGPQQRTKRNPVLKEGPPKQTPKRLKAVAELLNRSNGEDFEEISGILGIKKGRLGIYRAIAAQEGLLTKEAIEAVYTRKPRGMAVGPIKTSPSVLEVANLLNKGKRIEEIAKIRGNEISSVRVFRYKAKMLNLLKDPAACFDRKSKNAHEKYKK